MILKKGVLENKPFLAISPFLRKKLLKIGANQQLA